MRQRIACTVLAIMLVLAASACGDSSNKNGTTVKEGAYGILNDGEPVTLTVDLGNYLPTLNTEPTEQSPTVYQSTQYLADEFTKMYPNVTIKWDRTKEGFGDWAQYMTTQVAAGAASNIVFLQGSQYADKGWFVSLNDYLDDKNVFIEDNKSWKSTFPDYMWNSYMTTDAAGNIVAIPFTAYPGSATAYYYNKEIFGKIGVSVPRTWDEFVTVSKKINAAGYIAVAPWSGNKSVSLNNWDIQFSLGPYFAETLKDKWDYNKDDIMQTSELLRAEYEGIFYTKNNPATLEIYKQLKTKYTEVLQKGVTNTDYEALWTEGKVAMMEDGLWRLPTENANTKRKFEYGMFTPPAVTSSTSKYVSDVKYEKGAYQPPIETSLNVTKYEYTGQPKGAEEASVRFIQWLTKPENNSEIVMEKHGESIGAVKGAAIPPELDEWLQNEFPRTPSATWVMGPTVDSANTISRYLEMWVSGYITDDQFCSYYDQELAKGVEDQIKLLEIDSSGWKKTY